jgi:8-hydroxy-5-deazaflavin:NADPH oxidoreductase
VAASGNDRATMLDVAGAVARSEIVVLATPWPAAGQALAAAGWLAGKVLIDCTNPLKPDPSGLELGLTTSGAEVIASRAPGAMVVKAFNTIGSEHMAGRGFGGRPVSMLLAGDDAGAKRTVGGLARDLGFEPVDAGPLANARLLEPLALLWIDLATRRGLGTGIAFDLLRA